MKQQYFILVLAHSLHGRLRRVHVPYRFLYATLALAVIGTLSIFGFVSSYARIAWKVRQLQLATARSGRIADAIPQPAESHEPDQRATRFA